MLLFPLVLLIGIALGWIIASARSASAPPWITEHRPGEADRRLARMEQAAEETVRAVERLEEGQRFLLSALTDRQQPRVIGDGSTASAPLPSASDDPPAGEPHA